MAREVVVADAISIDHIELTLNDGLDAAGMMAVIRCREVEVGTR